MSEPTTKQLNDVLMYALQEALRINKMDAHLYNTLVLEHYKEAAERYRAGLSSQNAISFFFSL